MKKIILLATVFLLSSCMKLESEITLDANGVGSSRASIDMSKFITLIESFGTGTESAGINKNLCLDENFSGGLYESLSQEKNPLNNVKCTSLGDYKALVEGVQDFKNKKGVLFLSGVIVVDMLALGDENRVPKSGGSDDLSGMNAEDMGFSITQSYTLPGTIVFKDAGTLSGTNTIWLNLLDPKILNKRSLIVIATQEGKKLTPREINAYKLKLRKHNRSVR